MSDHTPFRLAILRQPLPLDSSAPPVCTCCSDQALAAKVLALLPGGMASVEMSGAVEEISVELVEAAPGEIVLVHAGVAIARCGG